MSRPLTEERLVLASHNAGKLREIDALLKPYGKVCLSAAAFDLAEPEETETTFAGNARIKAHYAARASNLPALSDDSGICVDALGGAPGVYTADWAETPDGRDFNLAMAKVWDQVQGTAMAPPYTARFHCTLCLAWPDGHDEIFEGQAEGHLVWPKRGTNGFGFDPMFQPVGYDLTFGEMEEDQKKAIAHRTEAFRRLVAGCLSG